MREHEKPKAWASGSEYMALLRFTQDVSILYILGTEPAASRIPFVTTLAVFVSKRPSFPTAFSTVLMLYFVFMDMWLIQMWEPKDSFLQASASLG